MGQQTENDKSPSGDGVPTTPATSGTQAPEVLTGVEEEPYVPRVFAFDPSVPAEVRDPVPPTSSEPSASGDGAEGADGAPERRSVLSGIRANAAEPPHNATDTAPTTVVAAWERPEPHPTPKRVVPAADSPTPDPQSAVTDPEPEPEATSEPEATPTPEAVAGSTAVMPATGVSEPSADSTAEMAPVEAATSADSTAVMAPVEAALPATGEDGLDAQRPSGDSPVSGEPVLGSPLDGFESAEESRRGWKRGLAWTGVGVVVLGGLYAGAQWFYADKVPHDTTIAGVEVGGLTSDAALTTLNDTLGKQAKEPIEVKAGDATATLDPAASGLAFDAAATVDRLTSFSLSPAVLWSHIVGGDEEDPTIVVDDAKLDAQIQTLIPTLAIAPVDGSVQFIDGAPVATPATAGSTVDSDTLAAELTSGWLRTTTPIPLATTAVEPAITQADTDAALAIAQKVISAPVTVEVGGQRAELPPEALAAAGLFTSVDGALALSFNPEILTQEVVDRTTDLLTPSADAHFEFVSGSPQVVGGKAGTTIDPVGLSAAVATAASGDARTAAVELVETDPAQSVQALGALGIVEKVSEFATPLTNESIRTKNLQLGASRLNGVLVKPGETFSLMGVLAPITTANGYFNAMTIQSGKHVDGVGGGLSQLSTTLFNAAYFSGVTLTEHQPHSRWFTRYPAGREATLFEGSIDNKFTNDTPYGILIQSWVDGGQVHVAFWSTKYYEVTTSDSGKSGIVGASVKPESGPDCKPMGAGQAGFSITNYRKVATLDGTVVKDETWPWTYAPDNGVSCTP